MSIIIIKEVGIIKIIGRKTGYLIHKTSNNNYCLCKILKEYDKEEDAKNDLIKLLAGTKKEEDFTK